MLNKTINKNALFWTLSKVKPHLLSLVLLTLISVLSGYLGVMFALGTRSVIDSATQGEFSTLLHASLKLGALICGIILCSAFTKHLYDSLEADLDRELKRQFMNTLLHGDFMQISKFQSGDLVHRLNSDVHTVISGLMFFFPNLAFLIVRSVAVVCVLYEMSPLFTIALMFLCLFIGASMFLLQRILKKLNKDIISTSGKISGFLQENIEKLLIIQALRLEDETQKHQDELLKTRWQLQRKRKNMGIFLSTGLSFLGYLISFVTLVWCAYQLLHGQMTFGSLTAITQLSAQLEAPVYALPSLLRQLITMSVSAERLMELEEVKQTSYDDAINTEDVYASMEVIKGTNLSFCYDRGPVLDHVSFSIPKDKLTVITGPSGIGKSTLLKLLLGLYTPSDGELAVVGNTTSVTLNHSTRSLFSYAPQGNLIFSGTLKENLCIVRPSATEEEMQEALYASAMNEYLSNLPNGIDTYLGENASGLSEGQAQRLSLARAILSQSPILLLDEVTSSLDEATEQKVLTRIRQLKGRTCIAVTHRPAVLKLADWQIRITSSGICSEKIQKT